MRVYVTNQSHHDTSKAGQYGKLIYVTEGKVNIFRTDDLIDELKEKLKDFKQDDFLVYTGNSVVCSLCLSILLTKHNIVKILIFNNHSLEYVLRQVDTKRLDLKED